MAPVNGKIVQGISGDENQLGLSVDFKNYKQNGDLLSLQSTKYQNGNGIINGSSQIGISQNHNNSLLNGNHNANHSVNHSTNHRANHNGKTTEEDDEESLINNKLVPLYTSLLDAIGEDTNRKGILKTPERAAKAIRFFTKGYQQTVAGKKC